MGFSAQWLALREAADHRSRHIALQNNVSDYLNWVAEEQMRPIRITDLGSGTGSNLRALAPCLTAQQAWTLVDHDSNLLQAARTDLALWADEVLQADAIEPLIKQPGMLEPLLISKNHKRIAIHFCCADLVVDVQSILDIPSDLVTAAAFFDLVAADWLNAFCLLLKKPLYAVLSYDGSEQWSPPDSSDAAILSAFHAHQKTDKGFGCALGPDAAKRMIAILNERGFNTQNAPSPWILDDQDRGLIEALATGTASAVRETNKLDGSLLSKWEHSRRQASHCEIGHMDIFAIDLATQLQFKSGMQVRSNTKS